MSISLSKEKLIEITGGRSAPAAGAAEKVVFSGIEYSSAEIRGGELFIALKGGNTHGHRYVNDAFARGAALVLVEDPAMLEAFAEPHRMVVVDDTLKAFRQLASYWRRELATPLLAVTGSVGKTTTKEIAASILLRAGQGTYSLKSHNNHVGVPYTLSRIKRGHQWAVVEMGMNHPGEIAGLSKLAGPDLAAITLIAPAHIMSFGGVDGIAAAKLEILEGLPANAPLIINADDPVIMKACRERKLHQHRPVRTFGTAEQCDARLSQVESHGLEGISFVLRLDGQELKVRMSALGRSTAINSACAALAARTLLPDLSLEQIGQGLEAFHAPLMRLNLKALTDERCLIDDSYNANPASMRAFLEFGRDLKSSVPGGVGLIIGDMLELGNFSGQYHNEIGSLVADVAPAFVIAVGEFAPLLAGEAARCGIESYQARSPEEAAEIALQKNFGLLMVKASRGTGLDRTVGAIIKAIGAAVP